MGSKWVLGCKSGKNGSKPTFLPTLNPLQDIDKNPLFAQFKGGGNCFPTRVLRQFRPSIILIFWGSDLFTRMLCSFCLRTMWATSLGFCRNRQNCRWTRCTEHASEKIRPSKRLELYIFQKIGPGSWETVIGNGLPQKIGTIVEK